MTEIAYENLDKKGEDFGRFLVVTQEVPWKLVAERLGGSPAGVIFVESNNKDYLDKIVRNLPACERIVGIGGGVAVDVAKYIAWRSDLPVVIIPTILSVDAYVTRLAGIRIDNEIVYVGTGRLEKVIVDSRVIQSAPRWMNTAGAADVYSCKTAIGDWRIAHEMIDEDIDDEIVEKGQRVVDTLLAKADEVKNMTEQGIRTLVELHDEANRLVQLSGKIRPEEGSEHIFFYAVDEVTKRSFLHGELVGTGIYIISHFQQGDEDVVGEAMERMGIRFRPSEYGLSQEEFIASVLKMKPFAKSSKALYSVLDKVEIEREDAGMLWSKLAG